MNNINNLRRRLQNLRRLYREDREAFNNSIKRMPRLNAEDIVYDPTLYFETDRRFTLNDAKILRKIIDRANGPLVPLFEGINSLSWLMRNANDTTKDYIIRRILGIENKGLARKIKTMSAGGTFREHSTIDNKNFKNKTGRNYKTFLDSIESVPFSDFMETHYSNGLKRQRINAAVKGYKVRRPKVVKKKGNALVSNIESSLRRLPSIGRVERHPMNRPTNENQLRALLGPVNRPTDENQLRALRGNN